MGENTYHDFAKTRANAYEVETIARKLLEVIVHDRGCRTGDKLTLDDPIDTSDIGDWKMSAFDAARTYAVAEGRFVIEGDSMRLTTAGSAAA